MKYATHREYADPEKAARKLLEIANTSRPSRTGASISRRSTARSYSREAAPLPNTRMALSLPSRADGSGKHESGTYVKFTQASADLFA
jgi:hypothetical protein